MGYFGGIGAASRLGILFKGGNYLDAIARINTVVFDKTGTLTKGTFEVQSCHTPQGISEEKLLQVIASAEQNSTHPIAKAITGYAKQRHILLSPATEVTEIAGRGLEARIDGQRVLAGNTRLLSEYKVEYPQELSEIADTVVVCAIGSAYAGYLLLSDTLKDDACTAIEELKALNINNIQILSGDKQAIVTNFAEKLGVARAYGDLLPDDHDLRDRLFVDLHFDLDPSPEFGVSVAFFERLVTHVGDLQVDRVAENPVAAVDGHDAVEILLDGRSPQRVGPADERDRGAQQRVVRLLVLDRDDRARRPAEVHGLVREGEGLERMIPRRMCGGHADKPEKGENQ